MNDGLLGGAVGSILLGLIAWAGKLLLQSLQNSSGERVSREDRLWRVADTLADDLQARCDALEARCERLEAARDSAVSARDAAREQLAEERTGRLRDRAEYGRQTGPGPLRGMRILVVDDNDEIRNLFAHIFADERAIVRAVGSAEEGVRVASEWTPDLVVSDIAMPGEDGCSMLARLRALPGCEAIPALAVTGFGGARTREQVREAGFAHLLAKPVVPAELTRIAAELLESSDAL